MKGWSNNMSVDILRLITTNNNIYNKSITNMNKPNNLMSQFKLWNMATSTLTNTIVNISKLRDSYIMHPYDIVDWCAYNLFLRDLSLL